MSKSQQRRLKIQMSLSERIRNDVIGIKRPADYWAEKVAQLEAKLDKWQDAVDYDEHTDTVHFDHDKIRALKEGEEEDETE